MAAAERPLMEVLNTLFGSVEDIVRAQVSDARAELRQDIARATHAARWFAVVAFTAFFAAAFLLLALYLALANTVPGWAAALIIGGVLGIITAITLRQRRARLRALRRWLTPVGTHFKETMPWVRPRTK